MVTGAGGQLATELARADWADDFNVIALGIEDLDITSAVSVAKALEQHSPSVVVNAAAFTAVDAAEEQRELARAVNVGGVHNLVQACQETDAGLIHVSTDYVFDGQGLRATNPDAYLETDTPNPVNFYGQTKLDSEYAALALEKSVVLRTSWVYSAIGHNFVKTMIRLAKEGKELGVVHDQLGCPTSAADLASAIVSICQAEMVHRGLFHCASPTTASWWDLADSAVRMYGVDHIIDQITTEEYPLPAKRPLDTRLDCSSLRQSYGIQLRPWQEALDEVVSELIEKGF